MDHLAALPEEARKLALDRFRLIQPHLEQDQSLASIAQAAPGSGRAPCGLAEAQEDYSRPCPSEAAVADCRAVPPGAAVLAGPWREHPELRHCVQHRSQLGGGPGSPGGAPHSHRICQIMLTNLW